MMATPTPIPAFAPLDSEAPPLSALCVGPPVPLLALPVGVAVGLPIVPPGVIVAPGTCSLKAGKVTNPGSPMPPAV